MKLSIRKPGNTFTQKHHQQSHGGNKKKKNSNKIMKANESTDNVILKF